MDQLVGNHHLLQNKESRLINKKNTNDRKINLKLRVTYGDSKMDKSQISTEGNPPEK